MVQTFKGITRWCYGYNYRLVFVLLRTWAFWVGSDLDATRHSQSVCRQLVTANLIKLNNWLPGYKSPQSARSRLGFRPIFLKRNEILFCLLKFQLSLLQLPLGLLHQNDRPRDWDFNHIRLRSRTWNSEMLPVQCLFSKLRRPSALCWQEAIRAIVAQFPELKLSGSLGSWGLSVPPASCL